MAGKGIEVRDQRQTSRHGVVWAADWDTPRFRLLSPAQRVVYVTLTLYASGGKGDVWPRQATIATTTGLSQRAVEDAIRRLAELGYLQVTRKPGGMRRHNIYTLLSPPKEAPA